MRMNPSGDALFYGDNLDILRNHIEDESVDLVYLDPPFNSNANYNVLFRAPDGSQSQSQIVAFDDTWHWTDSAEAAFDDVMRSGHSDAAEMLRAMRAVLKENDMMAYLAMMAVRLIELHRVLKPTGSLYLHCDPTASHYLKILLDAVFGVSAFSNEIIWQRSTGKSLMTRRLPINHDSILFVQKGTQATWNDEALFIPYDETALPESTKTKYTHRDSDGRLYRLDNLINPNPNRPNLTYEFLGVTRVWRWTRDRMETAFANGLVVQTNPGTVPQLKRYLDEQRGLPIGDIWTDIPPINSQAAERLGYPTQKPVALLERILKASSNENDLVLDPFCGCGTTIHAAEKLNRRWIGIDVTHLAVGLIRDRLTSAFPQAQFDILGVPRDLAAARELASADKHEFQLWALSMINAQPYKGGRKGADGGVDGYIWFQPDGRNHEKAVVSIKGGDNVDVTMIRDLIATVDREKAKVGVFVTLATPKRTMKTEAAAAGFYESPHHGRFAKIQILTIEELFEKQKPHLPWIAPTSKSAKRETSTKQIGLDF
jgi:site-specific DNA-methyltransferase (adenine-specific)